MKTPRLVAVLVNLAVIALLATDASAMYHPTMGRFMQRDPGSGGMMAAPRVGTAGPSVAGSFLTRDQYADGMNLYQYAGTNPVTRLDPNGLDDATAEEVRLRVVLDQAHGTTEAKRAGTGRWRAVGASWEEGWGTWLVHLAGRAIWAADSSIDVDEEASAASWKATLEIINRLPQQWINEGWWLQTSVDYWWTASAENVCCKSGKVSITASGWGIELAPGQGTFYSVPDSEVHAIPKGDSKNVGRVYLGATIRQRKDFLLLIRGGVQISAECVP